MGKIIHLSEAASIAIHAMVLIAKSNTPVNVIFISESTNTSRHHAAKVMQRLAKDHLVSSQRGPTGGYTLKKDAGMISFLNIYESIEGHADVETCVFKTPICTFEKCIMNHISQKMSQEFIKYLSNQKLNMYL